MKGRGTWRKVGPANTASVRERRKVAGCLSSPVAKQSGSILRIARQVLDLIGELVVKEGGKGTVGLTRATT